MYIQTCKNLYTIYILCTINIRLFVEGGSQDLSLYKTIQYLMRILVSRERAQKKYKEGWAIVREDRRAKGICIYTYRCMYRT